MNEMTPAEQAVLGDRLRELGLPADLIARLLAVDELYFRAKQVTRHLGRAAREQIGLAGPEPTLDALDALDDLVERLTFDPICYCGSLESDWNEHQAPHGNHAFVGHEEVLTRPPQQQP